MAQRQTEFFSGYDVIMYCFDNYKKGKRLKHQHGEHSSAFLSGTNQMAHELQPYVHDVDNKRVYCTGSSPKLVAEKTMIYQVYYLADTSTYTSGCIFKKDQVWNVKSTINLKNENLEKGMSYENDEDFRLLGTVGQILEDIIPQTQATHNDDDDEHGYRQHSSPSASAPTRDSHEEETRFVPDPFVVNIQRTLVTDDTGARYPISYQESAVRMSYTHAFEQPSPYPATPLVNALPNSDDDNHNHNEHFDDNGSDTQLNDKDELHYINEEPHFADYGDY